MNADDAIQAIRSGNAGWLATLLDQDPSLVSARVQGPRTLLHVVADWPGHFPNGRAVVALLVSRGADPNSRFFGKHQETPLHWAASSNDVEVLDALLDAGADIEAPGAVIGGGTPLADAVGFGQWDAARRLVERGAKTTLWQASGLGLLDRARELAQFATAHEITNAFWNACNGAQRETAAWLLTQGADINWIGHDGLTPLAVAVRGDAKEVCEWLRGIGARN